MLARAGHLSGIGAGRGGTNIAEPSRRNTASPVLPPAYISPPALFGETPENAPLHDPNSYAASQAFARELMAIGSQGVIYRSVRRPGSECLACFRPALVANVRPDAHFEYRWEGTRTPAIRRLVSRA